jgi:hypothetical protein
MVTRKIRTAVVLLICAVMFSGCADIKSKFIRKKKEPEMKRYVPVREYDVRPSMELYTKRYIYWKNWHREVMALLKDPNETNNKKIVVAIEQENSNLIDMRNMLVDEKAEQLQQIIEQMAAVEMTIKKEKVTAGNRVQLRRKMDLLGKEIKDKYSYRKMAGDIRDEFARD